MRAFNERIALWLTKQFGSMRMFYLFCFWALLPFIPILNKYKDMILYISAGFVQLVALPLIMVGGNLIGAVTERRDQQQFDAVMQELELAKQMRETQSQEIQELKELHKDIHTILKAKNTGS